jgi:hypothetical protein
MVKVDITVKLTHDDGKTETIQVLDPFNLYGNEIDEFLGTLKDKTARLRNGFFDSRT